jgi:hypothetical protein
MRCVAPAVNPEWRTGSAGVSPAKESAAAFEQFSIKVRRKRRGPIDPRTAGVLPASESPAPIEQHPPRRLQLQQNVKIRQISREDGESELLRLWKERALLRLIDVHACIQKERLTPDLYQN